MERLEQACRATEEGGGQLKGSVQSLDRRVQQLEVSSAVAAAREPAVPHSAPVQALTESLGLLASRVTTLEANAAAALVAPRSAAQDPGVARVQELEQRLQALEARAERHSQLAETAESRTADVAAGTKSMELKLEKVDSKIRDLELLESKVRQLSSKAENVHKLEESFKSEVNEVATKLRAVEELQEQRFESGSATEQRLGQDLDGLRRDLQTLKKNVDTVTDDLQSVKDSQSQAGGEASPAEEVENVKEEFAKTVESFESLEQDLRSELWEVRCVAQEAQGGARVNELEAKIESSSEDVQIHMSSIKRAAASAEQVAADAEESVTRIQKLCEEQQSAIEKVSTELRDLAARQATPSVSQEDSPLHHLENKVSSLASAQESLTENIGEALAAAKSADEAAAAAVEEIRAELLTSQSKSAEELTVNQSNVKALREDLVKRLDEQAESLGRLHESHAPTSSEESRSELKSVEARLDALESTLTDKGDEDSGRGLSNEEILGKLEDQNRSIASLQEKKLTMADISDEDGGTLLTKLMTDAGIIEKLEEQGRAIASVREQKLTLADIDDEEGGTLLVKLRGLEQRLGEAGQTKRDPELLEKLEEQDRAITKLEERIGEASSAANVRELVERLEEQSRSISELRGQKLTLADISDEEGGTLLTKLRGVEQLVGEVKVSVKNDSELVEKLEDQGREIASLRERRLTVTDIGDDEGGTLLKKLQRLEQKVGEAGSAKSESSLVEKLEDQGRAIASLRERRITLADITAEDGSDLLTKLQVIESKVGGLAHGRQDQQGNLDDSRDEAEMPSAGSAELLVPSWARQEEQESKFSEAKTALQEKMDRLEEEIVQVRVLMGKCEIMVQEHRAAEEDSQAQGFEVGLHAAQTEYQSLEKELRFTREEIVTIDSVVSSPAKMTPGGRASQSKSGLGEIYSISERVKRKGEECRKLKENLETLISTGSCANLSAEASAFTSSIHESLEYSVDDTSLSEGASLLEGDTTASLESDSALASGSLQAEEEGILAEIRKTEARIAQYNGWSLEVEILQMNLDELKKDLQRVRSSSGSTPGVTGSSDSVGGD